MSISVETLALAKKNTKQAVEEAVTSVYRYKGSVETFEDLPTSGQKVGDVYNVADEAGKNYAWDGSNWDALGIAENLGDVKFQGPGETEVEISFDGNNDRIVYDEYIDCSKAIPLENLTSNEIIIEHEGHHNPYYIGLAFSNSTNDISFFSGPGIPVQNTNNQSVYTIENYESYKETYKYFFLPLTHEKRGPQGQSTGEKEEYFINPIIKYKVLEQGMVTKTINQNFDDSDKVDAKVQVAKDAAQAANNQANAAYNAANTAYLEAGRAGSKAMSAYDKANIASNAANNAYNAANIVNNSLNDLGNVEFSIPSSGTTTVTKDLINDKVSTYGVPIRAREVKDGKITIKVTNNQDMPTVQYPSSFRGGYGPTPQQTTGGPGGMYTPSISSSVDEYIFTIDGDVIQNDYYVFIKNEVTNMGTPTGFFFQGTLSYETEAVEKHTINNDYYDKDDVDNLVSNATNDLGNIEFESEGLDFTKKSIDNTDPSSYQNHTIKTVNRAVTTPGLTYNEIMYTLDHIGYIIKDVTNSVSVDSFYGCMAKGYTENSIFGGTLEIEFQRIGDTNTFSCDISTLKEIINLQREKYHYKYFFLCLVRRNESYYFNINNGIIDYYKSSQNITTKTINSYYIDKYQINTEIEKYVEPIYTNANNAMNYASNAYSLASNAYSLASNAYNQANVSTNIANNAYNGFDQLNQKGINGTQEIFWIENDAAYAKDFNLQYDNITTYTAANDKMNNDLYKSIPSQTVYKNGIRIFADTWGSNIANLTPRFYGSNYADGHDINYSSETPRIRPSGRISTYDGSNYFIDCTFNYGTNIWKYEYIFTDTWTRKNDSSSGTWCGVTKIEYNQKKVNSLKNDYYDKDASNSLTNDTLNAAKAYTDSKFDISLKKEVVQTLPVSNIDEDTLYLVPKSNSTNGNIYDEYLYTSNEWELIGDTETDLSGYYTSNQVDNALSNKQNTLIPGQGIDITNDSISVKIGDKSGYTNLLTYDGGLVVNADDVLEADEIADAFNAKQDNINVSGHLNLSNNNLSTDATKIYPAVLNNDNTINTAISNYPGISTGDFICDNATGIRDCRLWKVLRISPASTVTLITVSKNIEIIDDEPIASSDNYQYYREGTVVLSKNGHMYECKTVTKIIGPPVTYTYSWDSYGIDLSNYYTSNDVDNIASNLSNDITNVQNSADQASNAAANASNLAQAAYDAANSLAPAAWQEIANVTTNEATNSITLPIDKEYDEYLITFNNPVKMDGNIPADSMTGNDGTLNLSIGGYGVIGNKIDIYEKMNGVYTIENIVGNTYHATGYSSQLQGAGKSYAENIIDINDATNGGAVLYMSQGSTTNIASNVTITIYGKGVQETE